MLAPVLVELSREAQDGQLIHGLAAAHAATIRRI